MGACFSDVKGGQQAIGGVVVDSSSNNANQGGFNEAVDFLYKSHGFQPLLTYIEVISKLNLTSFSYG